MLKVAEAARLDADYDTAPFAPPEAEKQIERAEKFWRLAEEHFGPLPPEETNQSSAR